MSCWGDTNEFNNMGFGIVLVDLLFFLSLLSGALEQG